MLLQFAVGPMCLLVFNTSASHGLALGITLVLAITLVDLLFIALSCFGIGSILSKTKVKNIVKLLGALVLILFGVNMIAGAFDISILPNIKLFSEINSGSIFIQGLFLTASNPLTIIFWGGVFSTQVIENGYNKKQLYLFGIGCVLSTISFLTLIAVLSTIISGFLNATVIKVLNIFVGIIIIYFGTRLMLKKNNA